MNKLINEIYYYPYELLHKMTHTITVHNMFLADIYVITIPSTVNVLLDQLDVFIDNITNINKYFNEYFTEEELEYINKYYDKLCESLMNESDDDDTLQMNKKIANWLKKTVIGKTNIKRKVLNAARYPRYEGFSKIGNNEYGVQWGS